MIPSWDVSINCCEENVFQASFNCTTPLQGTAKLQFQQHLRGMCTWIPCFESVHVSQLKDVPLWRVRKKRKTTLHILNGWQ